MTITPEKTNIWQYWHLEDTPELHLPTFEDYVVGFLEVYTEAVNCRLRSSKPVGVTLSGGLDSGSVTALAAQTLFQQGKRLPAYTAVPLYDVQNTVGAKRFGDETELAQATAKFYPNIDHHLLTSSQISPIEGIHRILAIRNEPGHAGANYYWVADLLQTVQQQGIGTLLTGQGGNATISWTGAPFLTSLHNMWQTEGWKAAIKQKLPLFARRALRKRRLKKANWKTSAIHHTFAQRTNLIALQIASIGENLTLPESIKTPQQLRYAIIAPNNAIPGAMWSEFGAGFGIETRDPTLDKRVLTYTISIPDKLFSGPNGQDRWLIRMAMARMLPSAVCFNYQRGRQAADIGRRLLQSTREIERLLTEISMSNAINYIDVAKLKEVWLQLQHEITPQNTHDTVTILMRGLNVGLFFLRDCGNIKRKV